MNPSTAPPAAADDWSSWEPLLSQFSQATHCTTTLYAVDGQPAIGPICSSDIGVVLGHSSFFGVDGEGRRFEQALAAQAALQLEVIQSMYLDQLAVVGVPLVMFGKCHGAIVFGWLPVTFSSSLGAERIAAAARTDPRRLWTVMRLQSPLGPARVELYARFLSSLVAAHTRLRETLSEIGTVTRLREESLARVAHELRTPLSSVMLRLSALLSTQLDKPAEIRAALEAVIRNVREESRLIDDIVDSARSQTGQLSISPMRCNIVEVVSAAVDTVLPQARAKDVDIVARWSGGDEELVEGDRGRLQQVFWNLLANAVKFTPPGGKVTLDHRRRESMHEIAIRDTGAGIPRQMLGQIFDPFVRERSNNDSGLGLGLSIARHIVELHGGRILVESDGRGKGSTFAVVLPAFPAARPGTD
ncbi:MAG: HAMP domain-containing histidine kinase [Comamonadaceae bacterium]|nr:MAG: HAMP domain-containing histidine kinase [Comamonadaceae bacterium]